MKLEKFAAAAALAVAALTVPEATAFAEPAEAPVVSADVLPSSAQGVDRGVGYSVERGADGRTLVASLTGGSFQVTSNKLEVTDVSGAVVASVPLHMALDTYAIEFAPRVEANGTRLVADVSAQEIGYWRKTSPRERSIEAGMAIGSVLGSIGGVIVGVVAGIATMGLLLPITLPVGMLVGALGGMGIGGALGGSIPNSDVPDMWQYQQECDYYNGYQYCW